MARSIGINSYLKQQSLNENEEYHKQIYICNSNWHPPPASILIENQITAFEKLLKAKQQELEIKNQNSTLLNLTPLQKSALIKLRQNNSIIIKPTDKNLGPAIMDTETYTKQILQDHLLTNNYLQLSSAEAQQRYNTAQNDLKNLITSNKDAISKPELTYSQEVSNKGTGFPFFMVCQKCTNTQLPLGQL
jgi:hypothetical protein